MPPMMYENQWCDNCGFIRMFRTSSIRKHLNSCTPHIYPPHFHVRQSGKWHFFQFQHIFLCQLGQKDESTSSTSSTSHFRGKFVDADQPGMLDYWTLTNCYHEKPKVAQVAVGDSRAWFSLQAPAVAGSFSVCWKRGPYRCIPGL